MPLLRGSSRPSASPCPSVVVTLLQFTRVRKLLAMHYLPAALPAPGRRDAELPLRVSPGIILLSALGERRASESLIHRSTISGRISVRRESTEQDFRKNAALILLIDYRSLAKSLIRGLRDFQFVNRICRVFTLVVDVVFAPSGILTFVISGSQKLSIFCLTLLKKSEIKKKTKVEIRKRVPVSTRSNSYAFV